MFRSYQTAMFFLHFIEVVFFQFPQPLFSSSVDDILESPSQPTTKFFDSSNLLFNRPPSLSPQQTNMQTHLNLPFPRDLDKSAKLIASKGLPAATKREGLRSLQTPIKAVGKIETRKEELRSLLLPDMPIAKRLPTVSAVEALDVPVMLPVNDRCTAGLSYSIRSKDDLKAVLDKGEIWCLFSVGIVPSRVPLGRLYHSFLTFHTTRFWVGWGFNWMEDVQGKFVLQTNCKGRGEMFLAGTGIIDKFSFWGVAEISKGGPQGKSLPNVEYVIGEFEDGKGGLVLDYRVDISAICPNQPDVSKSPKPSPFIPVASNGFLPPAAFSFLPANQHVDLARVIGKEEDTGAILYLVRSSVQDNNRPDRGMLTYMWSVWRSFDTSAVDRLPDVLGPTSEFNFKQTGVFLNYYARVLPFFPGF